MTIIHSTIQVIINHIMPTTNMVQGIIPGATITSVIIIIQTIVIPITANYQFMVTPG
jgi:hypothetical protein